MPQPVLRLAALLSAAAGAAFATACSSSSTGPSLTGDWHGFVALHDEYGVPLARDSGVVVTVTNNGHMGPSTISNAAGSYTLPGLHTGTYSLMYSGAGIGSFQRSEIGFIGGGTQFLGLQNLSQISTGAIAGLAVTPSTGGDTLRITGSIGAPPMGLKRDVRLFYGSATTVSAAPATYRLSTLSTTSTGVISIAVTGADLAAVRATFGTGNPAYVIAYGDSFFSNSYVDTTTGNTVYPNVSTSPSNAVAFAVP